MAGFNCAGNTTPTGFAWISEKNGTIAPSSVHCGVHGSQMSYVGRVYHKGDLIPGCVVPSQRGCYVSWKGKAQMYKRYEVLSSNGSQYQWVHASRGYIPVNAVQGGYTSTGEPLYVGRHKLGVYLISGKIHPSHQCIYIPYKGKEYRFEEYEALVTMPTGYVVQPTIFPAYPIVASPFPTGSVCPTAPSVPSCPAGPSHPNCDVQPGLYPSLASTFPQL